jgi:hypothetical protein
MCTAVDSCPLDYFGENMLLSVSELKFSSVDPMSLRLLLSLQLLLPA